MRQIACLSWSRYPFKYSHTNCVEIKSLLDCIFSLQSCKFSRPRLFTLHAYALGVRDVVKLMGVVNIWKCPWMWSAQLAALFPKNCNSMWVTIYHHSIHRRMDFINLSFLKITRKRQNLFKKLMKFGLSVKQYKNVCDGWCDHVVVRSMLSVNVHSLSTDCPGHCHGQAKDLEAMCSWHPLHHQKGWSGQAPWPPGQCQAFHTVHSVSAEAWLTTFLGHINKTEDWWLLRYNCM